MSWQQFELLLGQAFRLLGYRVIDGVKLKRMIVAAKKVSIESTLEQPESISEAPTCPASTSSMIKRKARKGAGAGKEFWGCSQLPKCRGIVSVN